jgi:hypothetical protein
VCAVTVTWRVASSRLSWGARLPVGGPGGTQGRPACLPVGQARAKSPIMMPNLNVTAKVRIQLASLRLRAGSPAGRACPSPTGTLTVTAEPPAGLSPRACSPPASTGVEAGYY